jgi:phosphoesterase RecJ-like protein
MIDLLFKKIEEYDTIIIHRHNRPDGDAIGSQLGLAETLKYKYPYKNIYCVGDEAAKYSFLGKMDNISDEIYENALVIIVDVAVKSMVSDDRYKLAKEVFIIDHHRNESDVTTNHIVDVTRVAAAEFIAAILLDRGFEIPQYAATCLYCAIITDGGRFMYGSNLAETLRVASELVKIGADYSFIYSNIYVEKLEDKQMKNYFSNRFEMTENGVAYLKNTHEVFEKFPREFNDISRGMLSVMSGVEEIKIWLNFTYDISKDVIVGEFRSRDYSIVDIAKKWGGGGHSLACGASIKTWEDVDLVIADFDSLLKEAKNNEG